jgi:polyisoprenoid-binding protein YceI
MRTRRRATLFAHWTFAIAAGTLGLAQSAGQTSAIDVEHSKLIVHVSKAGLFSAFADDHQVEAPISAGSIDEAALKVTFVIDSRRLQVLDPRLSPDKRRQVQERMLGPDVLDAMRFPHISFASTSVEPDGPGRLLVRGQLSLHGMTRPVAVKVRRENGHYLGTSTFKQREFGITPVSVAGGTIKVKDELRIEFDIRTGASIPSWPR